MSRQYATSFQLQSLFLVFVLLTLPACSALQPAQSPSLTPIRLGMLFNALDALPLIADAQGYFTANGLLVTLKSYPSGKAAVEGMLRNEVDAATASEFVIVENAFQGKPVRAWASIDRYLHDYLIGRKDHGIMSIDDLRGKKIGVPLNTDAEFHLGRFLDLHGIPIDQVTLVDGTPADLVQRLKNGSVDLVAVWQPQARIIEEQFGSGVTVWPVQSEQASYFNLISTADWTGQHPALVKAFLRALHEAENFYTQHPDETRVLLQNKLSYDPADMAAIWPEHQFQLSLDQSMILAMEDESRWLINNRQTSTAETPDFLDYIYLDGMQSIRPEAVSIIK